MIKKSLKISTFVLASMALSACSNLPGIYKTDIKQGNVIDEERIARITPGMSNAEVKKILGTPIVSDAYHPNIWYYTFFHALSNGKEIGQSNFKVIFDKNGRVLQLDRS